MNQDKSGQLDSELRKVLNAHGFGFQYAVLRRAMELTNARLAPWYFEAAEFPVIAYQEVTHIDFVLRSKRLHMYLIAECKRANPARARWCFARAPYTWRNASRNEIVFDRFQFRPDEPVISTPRIHRHRRGAYHLGMELRTDAKGESDWQSAKGIKDAVAQVSRGTSGLIDHLFIRPGDGAPDQGTRTFIPVIFTTAELWVTETDLGAADVSTGDLPVGAINATRVNWLWFNHNRSQFLRHRMPYSDHAHSLDKQLPHEFARTVAIVGADGIDEFLRIDLEEWLG